MSGKGKVKPNNQVAPGPIGNTQGLIVPQTSPNASGPGNSAPPPKPTPKEEGWWKRWGSDALHTTLDVVGMIPGVGEVADGANALVYLAEGDKVSAALSAAASRMHSKPMKMNTVNIAHAAQKRGTCFAARSSPARGASGRREAARG